MNYYQFHISDWALHTSHLTLEEEAVYRRLLDYYYDTEKPIPKETNRVIRRLRLGSHEQAVALILDEFFKLDGDSWHNTRADKEIAEYHAKADRARANGKKGGRPPSATKDKTKVVNSGNPEKTGSKANQEPITKNQEPITKNQEPVTNKNNLPDKTGGDEKVVFDFWHLTMNKTPKHKLTPGRMKAIKSRLKDFSVDDLKTAIIGCTRSSHHMGNNPRSNPEGKIYDDLTLIMRNPENVNRFMGYASNVTMDDVRESQVEEWINATDEPMSGDVIQGEVFEHEQH